MKGKVTLSHSEKTDTGKVRRNNQDYMISMAPEGGILSREGALFVIADGLGGLAHGEIASREAVETFQQLWRETSEFHHAQGMKKLFEKINAKIFEMNREKRGRECMATTLTASFFSGFRLLIAHVGDCRVYRIRGGKIDVLTSDHSIDRHTLTRAIGIDADVQTDLYEIELKDGDDYLQCSDGLYSVMSNAEILDRAAHAKPRETCDRLVALANERGGPDNITVQAIQISNRDRNISPSMNSGQVKVPSLESCVEEFL